MSGVILIRHGLILGALLLMTSASGYAHTLILDDNADKFSGLNHIKYLVDPSGEMTQEQVMHSQLWQPLTKSNLGYLKSPVWTYLSLQNTSDQTLNLIFYNPRAGMDYLHVHLVKENQVMEQWVLGDLQPALNHPIINRYSAIPFTLKPHQKIGVLTKLENIGPIEANWAIRSTADFAYTNIQENLVWGLLIGLALMLFIYHLNLFFSLRMASLLLFVGMIVFGVTTQLSINGFFRNLNWLNDWQPMINLTSWVTHVLSLIFLSWFTIHFLNTRKTMPFVHKLLILLIAIETLVLAFFIYAILFNQALLAINTSIQIIAIATMLIPFVAAVIALRLKLTGAPYYLLSQFAVVLAGSVQISSLIGLIEITHFTAIFPAFGYIIHMIFIALTIGQQLSLMQDQSQKQRQLLLIQSRLSDIGQTFGNITHQAKLPLSRIGSQISLLQGLNQTPSEIHYQRMQTLLPKIRNQVDLLQTTVEDFKQFYNAPLRVENVSIGVVIQQVLDLLCGKMVLSCTEVKFITPHSELKVSTDASALSHVMMILLDNAFDILLERKIENSVLSIGYDIDRDDIIIWLRDQAGGIRIKPINRIFENFVSDKKQAGTGIGLCIAKLMVEDRLQGQIQVANTADGAQFTLKLQDLKSLN